MFSKLNVFGWKTIFTASVPRSRNCSGLRIKPSFLRQKPPPVLQEANLLGRRDNIFKHAQLAMSHSRNSIPQKSGNKSYGRDDLAIPKAKVEKYRQAQRSVRASHVIKVQKEIHKTIDTWENSGQPFNVKELAKIIYRHGEQAGGNCYEHAIVAYDYLSEKLPDAMLDIVCLRPPGDHAFVVIDQPKIDGSYPKNFKKWNKDAFIVDPWANIACPARDYPQEWKKKMHKWADRKLQIDDQSPLSNQWLNALKNNNKFSELDTFRLRKFLKSRRYGTAK